MKIINSIIGGIGLYLLMTTTSHTQAFRTDEYEEFREEFIRIGKTMNKNPAFEVKARMTRFYKFKDEQEVYGLCYTMINSVHIYEKTWAYMPIENKEELIFHEMAHCVLGKEHTDGGIMNGKGPLMNKLEYRKNYSKLLHDLFDCKNDCPEFEFNPDKYKNDRKYIYQNK